MRFTLHFIVFCFLPVFIGCSKSANDYIAEASDARKNKNYLQAVELYLQAIKLGSSDAAFELGSMYRVGKEIEPDARKAADYLAICAREGNLKAQVYLAELYGGKGNLKADEQKKLYWMKKAADAGDAWAIRNLAHAYGYGKMSLNKDIPQSIMLYFKGGTAKNAGPEGEAGRIQCYKAFVLAALDASNRDIFSSSPSKEHVEGTQEYTEANDLIFKKYSLNLDVDIERAFELYRISANKGSAEGLYSYGAMLYWGIGLKRNPTKGLAMWTKAMKAGLDVAEIMIGAFKKGKLLPDQITESDMERYLIDEGVPDELRIYGERTFGDYELGDTLICEQDVEPTFRTVHDYRTDSDVMIVNSIDFVLPVWRHYYYTPVTKRLYMIEQKFETRNMDAALEHLKKYYEGKLGFKMQKKKGIFYDAEYGEKGSIGVAIGATHIPMKYGGAIQCTFIDTALFQEAKKESDKAKKDLEKQLKGSEKRSHKLDKQDEV